MRTGRPHQRQIKLSETERSELQSLARSRALPAALVRRARVVLLSADGQSNSSIAQSLDISAPTVGTWRKRYVERGIAGLYGEKPPEVCYGHSVRKRTKKRYAWYAYAFFGNRKP